MRWIFFCLVVLNLAVLLFYWNQSEVAVVTDQPLELASGQRLTLISEAAVSLPKRSQQVVTEQKQQLCFLLGPYQDQLDANYARARATSLGIAGDTVITELPTDTAKEFWVYVPPRASREEARKVLRELQQRKVDSYIINTGELADGISLGLFRQRESADLVASKVRSFNIPVEVKAKNEMQQEFWLQVVNKPDFGDKLRERIKADDDVSWQMTDCLR
ncbi:SPOR domain-containing protein [Oceanobacter mangrovi]|uniref:SPOR domain-containing protein n=1 Tax=Oceanobacter mangrovi TaxID=2862510 RepID=UPI001C8D2115|nr:SPOR domain-containing protein [Oceanobacter mangrovi]